MGLRRPRNLQREETDQNMTKGFLLGKFMPPHKGHMYLCSFAQNYCDELTILVGTQPDEPIPGAARFEWMRQLFPKARVLHMHRTMPQAPEEHPDFWNIWRQACRTYHSEKIDFVFASEQYGHRLAAELDARFVPVDINRESVPVSATLIRQNPHRYWDYIPAPVRAHFLKKICLFGPESTGKSTLALQLAQHYQSCLVPEYGRTYTENFGVDCSEGDLLNIAKGHRAATAAATDNARLYLIMDTDPLLTALWAKMLLGRRIDALDAFADYADLYLLCDIDLPWKDDGTRYFPDHERRTAFFNLCRDELEKRKLPYAVISGADRLKSATDAIASKFGVLSWVI